MKTEKEYQAYAIAVRARMVMVRAFKDSEDELKKARIEYARMPTAANLDRYNRLKAQTRELFEKAVDFSADVDFERPKDAVERQIDEALHKEIMGPPSPS